MFNILNKVAELRNYSPLVCKFLDKFLHSRLAGARCCSYLVERLGFRNPSAAAIGLPIALPLQAALMHFSKGRG